MLVSSRYLPRFRVDPLAAIFYRLLDLADGLRIDRASKAEKISTWNPFGCRFNETMYELRGPHLQLRGKLFEIAQDLLLDRGLDHCSTSQSGVGIVTPLLA